jgi:hypothetical protein
VINRFVMDRLQIGCARFDLPAGKRWRKAAMPE